VIGNQGHNIRLVIDNQHALGNSARFVHILNLPGYSSPRQPTVRHEHLRELLQGLLDTIVFRLRIAES
jgi:hypothetical protein